MSTLFVNSWQQLLQQSHFSTKSDRFSSWILSLSSAGSKKRLLMIPPLRSGQKAVVRVRPVLAHISVSMTTWSNSASYAAGKLHRSLVADCSWSRWSQWSLQEIPDPNLECWPASARLTVSCHELTLSAVLYCTVLEVSHGFLAFGGIF